MKDIEEFKRRTGIKDTKLDTFNQLWDKWHKEHPSKPTGTFGIDMGTTNKDDAVYVNEEFIKAYQKQIDQTRKEMNKRLFGDFTPHKKQREFYDHVFDDAVNPKNKEDVYDAEWEYAQKKLPKPKE